MNGSKGASDRHSKGLHEGDGADAISILSAASDVVLGLDQGGIIRDITIGGAGLPLDSRKEWRDKAWVDTVRPESRGGILEMWGEAGARGVSSRRQVFHFSASCSDLCVEYTTIKTGRADPHIVAFGRNLQHVSQLEQQLIEAQQSVERHYWRARQFETRFRALFQLSGDAVLVVDSASQKILEANPASIALFGQTEKRLVGRLFPFDLDAEDSKRVADQIAAVRAQGRADDIVVELASGQVATVSISLIRQAAVSHFVIRFLASKADAESVRRALDPVSPGLIRAMPDGFVMTDPQGGVLAANRTFLEMIEAPAEDLVFAESLGRWLGRPGADLDRLLAIQRKHGVARLFGTALRGEMGSVSEIEVSCWGEPGGKTIGFVLRDVGHRLAIAPRGALDLTRAVEQLTALVGRVSLKQLVRDTSDLVERHFIQAALEATDDNRTSGAEMLGLSRQSLYVKLRRYNLGPGDAGPPGGEGHRAAGAKGRGRSRKR